MDELRDEIAEELRRAGVPAVPVVMSTPWEVGAVTAYLFTSDPVTLIDAGVDDAAGRRALGGALEAHGLHPPDVRRVIVTHMHTDHFGGAFWLQDEGGCEVLLHPADIERAGYIDSDDAARELFLPLGFDEELLARFMHDGFEWRAPHFTPMPDGAVYDTGATRLRVEHHPGHTPGHVWVVDEGSGAIFVGDYVIADHPTNAGLEIDRSTATGRAPLLQQYNDGLRELARRDVPALFAGHGPPITDHAALIERRLAKTDRRTRHVLHALRSNPGVTALELGRRMYRGRAETSWEVLADVVGRLDLLVAEGHAAALMGEDGAWHFTASRD